jgi:hypothetical protein
MTPNLSTPVFPVCRKDTLSENRYLALPGIKIFMQNWIIDFVTEPESFFSKEEKKHFFSSKS